MAPTEWITTIVFSLASATALIYARKVRITVSIQVFAELPYQAITIVPQGNIIAVSNVAVYRNVHLTRVRVGEDQSNISILGSFCRLVQVPVIQTGYDLYRVRCTCSDAIQRLTRKRGKIKN